MEHLLAETARLTAPWKLGALLTVAPASRGAIHRTLLLETTCGAYALRCYRYRERATIEREHAVIAYAAAHGLPAVAPLQLPDGTTIGCVDGTFVSLFPQAHGQQRDLVALQPDEIAAMGAMLAQVHLALRDFPLEQARRRSFEADPTVTLREITELETAIHARPLLGADEQRTLTALAGRRAYLARLPEPPGSLDTLPMQLIHGDYQVTNLFFGAGAVSAIIDWDLSYLAPRAWEVLRALYLMWNFAPAPCLPFLRAYQAVWPLDDAVLEQAAATYAWLRAHNLWVYQELYLAGNDRVRQFIEPHGFQPVEDEWRALRYAEHQL